MSPEESHTTLVFLNLASLMSRPSPWLLKAFACGRLDSEQDLLGWGGRGMACLHLALVLSQHGNVLLYHQQQNLQVPMGLKEGVGSLLL